LKSQGQAPIYPLRASLPVEIEHWLTASDIVCCNAFERFKTFLTEQLLIFHPAQQPTQTEKIKNCDYDIFSEDISTSLSKHSYFSQ
jgi:hypothetical protein